MGLLQVFFFYTNSIFDHHHDHYHPDHHDQDHDQESLPHVIKYELRFDRLEEAVSRSGINDITIAIKDEKHESDCVHYLYQLLKQHKMLISSTFSVWNSFETFQFYLDKKDEVERMTLEDFVESVVSHAEVKDGNDFGDW